LKVLSIVGARPNFIKVASIHTAFRKHCDIESRIVHTGQHYDAQMSGIFFDQLNLPRPDYFLGINNGSHTAQTARIMLEFEKVIQVEKPRIVLVVGDVNSTLACALVAVKEQIPVAHVEAGLRSGDRRMPEEINRIITDSISDQLFVTEHAAAENLRKENIPAEKIHFTGNVLIDSLVFYRKKASELKIPERLNLNTGAYVLMTMHRPANVDDKKNLRQIVEIIKCIASDIQVVFPMHPRTWKNIVAFGFKGEVESIKGLRILEPQGYLEFLALMNNTALVITDSGGVQEETTFLNVPCITLRDSTERPVTVEMGTNYLLGTMNREVVWQTVKSILSGSSKKAEIPYLWDGNASDRIVTILREKYI
jgi:UDP-N-acetylglucosamine 2-epimerase (non-hydrolysing)